MLGHYDNFPTTVHGFAQFRHKAPLKTLQQVIVTVFSDINQKRCRLEEIAQAPSQKCEVGFEIGVGEEDTFVFLDKEEVKRLEDEAATRMFHFMDFLCVLRYHTVEDSARRAPLKFDYFMLRFAFSKNLLEFIVSHERGPRRIYVEDLMNFLTERVKEELAKHCPATLTMETRQTV
jgi:hypothetical protein